MNVNEYQWIPVNSDVYQGIPTNTNEYQWVPMNTNKYQRIPTNTNKDQQKPTKTNQKTRKNHEYQWIKTHILTNTNKYQRLPSNTIKYHWTLCKTMPPHWVQLHTIQYHPNIIQYHSMPCDWDLHDYFRNLINNHTSY